MKLWLLKPNPDLPKEEGKNPWVPWYDKSFGFVIRAKTEDAARAFAQLKASDQYENDLGEEWKAWFDKYYSTCEELKAEGEPGIILEDFWSA